MGLLLDMSFGSDQLKCRKQRSPHEICQEILKDLLEDEDNKVCADCSAKGKTITAPKSDRYTNFEKKRKF